MMERELEECRVGQDGYTPIIRKLGRVAGSLESLSYSFMKGKPTTFEDIEEGDISTRKEEKGKNPVRDEDGNDGAKISNSSSLPTLHVGSPSFSSSPFSSSSSSSSSTFGASPSSYSSSPSLISSAIEHESLIWDINRSKQARDLRQLEKLNIQDVLDTYAMLQKVESSGVEGSLMNAAGRVANEIRYSPHMLRTGKELRAILILLLNPALMNDDYHSEVLGPLCVAIWNIEGNMKHTLVRYLADPQFPADVFQDLVLLLQQLITLRILQCPLVHGDTFIAAAVRVLSILWKANTINENEEEKISTQNFYNDIVSNMLSSKQEFNEEFRTYKANDKTRFAFCHYPFIVSPFIKTMILRKDSKLQQRTAGEDEIQSMGLLARLMRTDRMIWRIARENLLNDTLRELNRHTPSDLRKELKVVFIGEEAVDEGGVQKELFMLITRQLFDPKFGMFKYSKETRTFWFNPSSDDWIEFELIGKILGLAIYNGIILDVQFPFVVYKKLMGKKLTFEDLCTSFPSLGIGLKQLHKYDGDVEDLCLTFEVLFISVMFGSADFFKI